VVHLSLALPSRRGVPTRASFAQWAGLALPARMRRGELSIRVVDTDEGRALNHQWRRRDYATNVLSFPADALPGGGPRLLGDLVLCAPVVLAEAASQRKPARHHWAHLTIHGVLHLLGHDHERPEDAERMEAIERKLLAGLGIPDPYQAA
jgi:probable rRNA maturation factor